MSARAGQRLDVIDALRGYAALAVVLYHIWNSIYPWSTTQVAPVLGNPEHPWYHESWPYYISFFLIQYGHFGVTIFFVLSGFCIHLPQARRHARTGNDGLELETFFRRRFWRLYPAYFAALIVASIALGVMREMEFRRQGLAMPTDLLDEAFGIREIFNNAVFLMPFFPAARDLNSVLWTLIFEVQFYLVYPFLLWAIRRTGWGPVGLVLFIAELLLVQSPKTPETYTFNNPWEYFFLARYFEWYLGALAAECFARRGTILPWTWGAFGILFGLAGSLASTFLPALWPYRELFVSGLTVCVLSALLRLPDDRPGRITRFFAWIGLFSYSLYLLHYPLLRLVNVGNQLLADAMGVQLEKSTFMLLLYAALPLVLAASYGFFWLFERPFLKINPVQKAAPLQQVEAMGYGATATPEGVTAPAAMPAR